MEGGNKRLCLKCGEPGATELRGGAFIHNMDRTRPGACIVPPPPPPLKTFKVGDKPFQKACKGSGIVGGGCQVIYVSSDGERVYTWNKYADMHPPQTPLDEFDEEDREHLKEWFAKEDPNWPGRSRVCCFVRLPGAKTDEDGVWQSLSSTAEVKVVISLDDPW